ncbi:lipase ROG1 family protein [Aspergillus undulatus]|uniref:lipase ROG1 family protein n=1 Tax=Aspergillus undulatus TaxID=1810928 RepID=UPI003CCDA7DC
MLITPRTYSASQTLDQKPTPSGISNRLHFSPLAGWRPRSTDAHSVPKMVLVRQAGNVRVGEIIRYTLTYQPEADEIQPPPSALHVKVKNTSAIPLRAAYLHGPYTLYASCYPKSFDPNIATDCDDTEIVPQFEPYLKAGGIWYAKIPISWHSQRGQSKPPGHGMGQDTTWIIEIVSQVIFSSTASVNFEVLVARDEPSLDGHFSVQTTPPKAAKLRDHWPAGSGGRQLSATKGIYSKSIKLLIDDTASLWNSPHILISHHRHEVNTMDSLATRPHPEAARVVPGLQTSRTRGSHEKYRKRVHLVILTHGLHSNLGADMLYVKESIDAAFQRNKCRRKEQAYAHGSSHQYNSFSSRENIDGHGYQDDDDEHIIVRGFPGNAARTERGIQYLGKRLAKYVLLMTYPDQPYLPQRRSQRKSKAKNPNLFTPWGTPEVNGFESEFPNTDGSQPHHDTEDAPPYCIAHISFIGHSLGGLVQTYAIAYIQKHSPDFFDKIKPVNFIALATPFLGLSNENPMYVRFALDFGLVGRTGQDLGLSWTAPRVKSGWETIIGTKSDSSKTRENAEVRAKPLLRILPSGPAHDVLAKFERRTLYSNLVNDGIVPLRTSCLLFLDWKGLQRVEKARRENGIVGTMAEWGWAELTGANSKLPKPSRPTSDSEEATNTSSGAAKTAKEASSVAGTPWTVATPFCLPSPVPSSAATGPAIHVQSLNRSDVASMSTELGGYLPQSQSSPLSGLLSIFKPKEPGKKQAKILKRSQTIATQVPTNLTQEDCAYHDHIFADTGLHAPPQTTVFESAGDILMPPLPAIDYIIDPSSRPQTILHDRVYQPEDIPPPRVELQTSTANSPQGETTTADHADDEELATATRLKVEEKIARAYHRGISWRKVLVRLEPDAHNNIIVRRMFANAYGWPVVRHLVDTHFGPNDSNTSENNGKEDLQSSPSPVVLTKSG